MTPERTALRTCWQSYLCTLPPDDPRRSMRPDAFAFGGGGELADELAALVLAGRKRATTSLPVEYTSLGEALPRAGDLSIVLDSRGQPVAIIERSVVELVPFGAVDEAYAAIEGEGDGSLRKWREDHTGYFNSVLQQDGGTLQPDTPVLCQQFHVVWRHAAR